MTGNRCSVQVAFITLLRESRLFAVAKLMEFITPDTVKSRKVKRKMKEQEPDLH